MAGCMILQAAQPQGVRLPRTVWEYRKEFPVRASVYFSGLLAAPRLTMFWLLLSEREMVQRVHDAAILRLQFIMVETRRSTTQVQTLQHGLIFPGNLLEARLELPDGASSSALESPCGLACDAHMVEKRACSKCL